MFRNERSITLLASAVTALASAAAYPVERVLMPDVPISAKLALAGVVFLVTFALLVPVWLPALIPSSLRKVTVVARFASGVLLVLVGLAAVFFALLVGGLRLHLVLLAALGLLTGLWHLQLVVRKQGLPA